MKRLPLWMIAVLAVLSVLMLWGGWHDRHEAGILPFITGVVWLALTVIALTRIAAPESD
jgi:hypothetical protein